MQGGATCQTSLAALAWPRRARLLLAIAAGLRLLPCGDLGSRAQRPGPSAGCHGGVTRATLVLGHPLL